MIEQTGRFTTDWIGPNGADKPDSGTFSVGPTVKLGYVDQSREISSRAYCGSFNFKGADQQKKVGHLSGGERNRVNLAKMLKSGANVLLLDEPTNDLDVDTLRARRGAGRVRRLRRGDLA